jgi:hypothetical protein
MIGLCLAGLSAADGLYAADPSCLQCLQAAQNALHDLVLPRYIGLRRRLHRPRSTQHAIELWPNPSRCLRLFARCCHITNAAAAVTCRAALDLPQRRPRRHSMVL